MRTVAIPNIDINVWTQKSAFPIGNYYLCSLMKPEFTRQRHFKLTDIEYDIITDETAMMERVEYNTDIGRNVIYVDDTEDFAKFIGLNM